jgi:hypothetical protein
VAKTYKMRTASQKGQVVAYSIAVPPEVGRALSDEMRFVCELVEEGILYRPATERDATTETSLPSWAYNQETPDPEPEPVK